MGNPWESIPLADYEGHMGAAGVGQLEVLAGLFGQVLRRYRPGSVAVLGVAGGNGLDRIDRAVTGRVVGVDINEEYLRQVRERFGGEGLELYRCDLCREGVAAAPVELAHAALVFEHTGLDPALEHAAALVAGGGRLSVVLQLPAAAAPAVGRTGYASLQALQAHFSFIDRGELERRLAGWGFGLVEEELCPVPGGKELWLGVFAKG